MPRKGTKGEECPRGNIQGTNILVIVPKMYRVATYPYASYFRPLASGSDGRSLAYSDVKPGVRHQTNINR
jgi:hypothetical protein